MDALRRWIDEESSRLYADGKETLSERFDDFLTAFFEQRYTAALTAIPTLRKLAETLREPAWQHLAAYYDALITVYWRGKLSEGMDIALRALMESRKLGARSATISLYLQEVLCDGWLHVDGPGYAEMVNRLVGETLPTLHDPELKARYLLLQARTLYLQGKSYPAADLINTILPTLKWPAPYRQSLRAMAFKWRGRTHDAIELYREALLGFGEAALQFECTDTRFVLADLYLAVEDYEACLAESENGLMKAGEFDNGAQVGQGLLLMGKSLANRGNFPEAGGCFSVALDTLYGLGWRRTEAEAALNLLSLCRGGYLNGHTHLCEGISAVADRLITRLPSMDLYDELRVLMSD